MLVNPCRRGTSKSRFNTGGVGTVTGGAAVIVNSNASDAAETTGGSTLIADDFVVTGGTSGTGFVGDITTGARPQPDPLRHLPQPNPGDYPSQSHSPKHFSKGNKTILR
jgi:hypothetical protein